VRLRRDGFPATAIDWGPWRRDSWTPARSGAADRWSSRLTELRAGYGITDEEGVDVLTRVLASPLAQVLVIPQDLDAMAARWRELPRNLLNLASSPESSHPRPQLRTPYVAPRNKLEHQITEVWRQHIGVDRVGVDDQFFELGGNSLIGLTILARLEKELNVRLSAADLFEAPTPAAFAGIVSARGGETQAAPQRGQRGTRRRHLAEAASLRRAARPKGGTR
jgi:acyl carrier protein